jgi:hypothetical protein
MKQAMQQELTVGSTRCLLASGTTSEGCMGVTWWTLFRVPAICLVLFVLALVFGLCNFTCGPNWLTVVTCVQLPHLDKQCLATAAHSFLFSYCSPLTLTQPCTTP